MSSEDAKPQIEEECAESHHCHGFKEKLSHCSELYEQGKESNCVEEFLELMQFSLFDMDGPTILADLALLTADVGATTDAVEPTTGPAIDGAQLLMRTARSYLASRAALADVVTATAPAGPRLFAAAKADAAVAEAAHLRANAADLRTRIADVDARRAAEESLAGKRLSSDADETEDAADKDEGRGLR
ncbi:hypothetical protein HK405_007951 [Cladochytrium tenue]|nr:hypothetical protein HK405_007951 [Cladochytrium tenue]